MSRTKIRICIRSLLILSLLLCGLVPLGKAQVNIIPSAPPGQTTTLFKGLNAVIINAQINGYMIRVPGGQSFLAAISSPSTNLASHTIRLAVHCITDPTYTGPGSPLATQSVRLQYRVSQGILGFINTSPATYGDLQIITFPTGVSQIITASTLDCNAILFLLDNLTTVNSDVFNMTVNFSNAQFSDALQPIGNADGSANTRLGPYAFTHISTATNTQIKATPGTIHTITINGGTAGLVTVVDTAVAACTGGATFAIIETIGATNPVTLSYDATTVNGICITTAAATDVTITWK